MFFDYSGIMGNGKKDKKKLKKEIFFIFLGWKVQGLEN